jgi:hypothetical protein
MCILLKKREPQVCGEKGKSESFFRISRLRVKAAGTGKRSGTVFLIIAPDRWNIRGGKFTTMLLSDMKIYCSLVFVN